MGIITSLAMMVSLGSETWIRLIVWLIIGFVVYFGYARKHSRVQAARAASRMTQSQSK
jgi:APA family basic amino acid/polyamine antiporter